MPSVAMKYKPENLSNFEGKYWVFKVISGVSAIFKTDRWEISEVKVESCV